MFGRGVLLAAILRWLLHYKSMEEALQELVYIRAHEIFAKTQQHRLTISKAEIVAWEDKLKQNTWAAWRRRKTVL